MKRSLVALKYTATMFVPGLGVLAEYWMLGVVLLPSTRNSVTWYADPPLSQH